MIRIVRLIALVGVSIALAGCISTAQYTKVEDPFKAIDAKNKSSFPDVKLALLSTQNTLTAFQHLAETKQFGEKWGSAGTAELDPQKIAEDVTRLLQSQFKEVIKVESPEQARVSGADVVLVFDMRIQIGSHSGADNTIQIKSEFRTIDGAPIDVVEAKGASTVPYPAFSLNFAPGWRAALIDFQGNLNRSTKLTSYAANRRLERADIDLAQSDAEPVPQRRAAPRGSLASFGSYHALVVGNNNYAHVTPLKTAEKDAQVVAAELSKNYGFKVKLLLNATRAQLLDAFDHYRKTLHESDNLLIYYAGHGYLDTESDRGYWIPVDADKDRRANWLSNGDIADSVRAIRAIHVLVVADSCYSGTLTRNLAVEMTAMDDLTRLAQKRARTALTSGGIEPVEDSGGGGHSIFAKAFIDTLRNNREIISMSDLFPKMRREVMLSSSQTPRYGDIRLAGHDGGDFIFIRANQQAGQ